jgi:hypothetical protein
MQPMGLAPDKTAYMQRRSNNKIPFFVFHNPIPSHGPQCVIIHD